MKKIIALLKQPHIAHDEPKPYFRLITIIALLVFFVLVVWKPFSYGTLYGKRLVYTAGIYAGTGYICMILNFGWVLCFPRLFAQTSWTLGKEMLMLTYQISSIATMCFLVGELAHIWPERKMDYVKAWSVVASGGILPYIVATMIKHIYLLKRNIKQSKVINQHIESKTAEGMPTGDEPSYVKGIERDVLVSDFLFAESNGNYLLIYWRKDGNVLKETVRMTIKQLEEHNNFSGLFRCHRAFFVNLDHVQHVEGNATGYQLTLDESLPKVSVSRGQAVLFRKKMESRAQRDKYRIIKNNG